jgi:hypothetical protein
MFVGNSLGAFAMFPIRAFATMDVMLKVSMGVVNQITTHAPHNARSISETIGMPLQVPPCGGS